MHTVYTYHPLSSSLSLSLPLSPSLSLSFPLPLSHSIALYAVDSLRQLGMKFLEKDELFDYRFQESFLRPFQSIVMRSQSTDIQEFVLTCIDHMLKARVHNLRSGWKAVLGTLGAVAISAQNGRGGGGGGGRGGGGGDAQGSLVRLAFETVHWVRDPARFRRVRRGHFAEFVQVRL